MERWAIKNRTSGTVEIGCIRKLPLQSHERHEFEGQCPDELLWLVGTQQVALTRLDARPAAPVHKPVQPLPAKSTKSEKP